MNRKDVKWLILALALYFAVGVSAWALARDRTAQMQEELSYQEYKTRLAEGGRDIALASREQWKAMYMELLKENAALKAENEELTAQIDVLRAPPAGAYSEIGWDFDYVVRVVGAEARGEPVEGILAVCQCIADTAERTGQTPEQVVKSGQYTSPVSRAVTDNMETVNECCLMVFLNGYRPYDEPIEYFYAHKNGYSAWHESQVFCYEIGGHRYFKGR